MLLWLIRHGETAWNANQRFQGWSDIPLNERGRDQARLLGERLQNVPPFDAVYVSDRLRALETAQIIVGDSASLMLEPRLREINFGKFEGLTMAEIRDRYPQEAAAWQADNHGNPHDGETLDAVAQRVGAFLDELRAQSAPEKRTLIVAHGGTLGILLSLAVGADPRRWWQFRLLNCMVNEVALTPRGSILRRFNDGEHFIGTPYADAIPHTFI